MKFRSNNKIVFGQDHQFWEGIPSDVDFKVESFVDGRYVLTGYGYGERRVPYDEHSYGNGSLYPYGLTKKQRELFKKNCVGKRSLGF